MLRSATIAGPPHPRNASAPAASITTSRMSALRAVTTPSSRCWATSASATTSSATPSPSPGNWSRARSGWAFPKTASTSPSSKAMPRFRATTKPSSTGSRRAFPKSASSPTAARTTSGRWARPAPAAPVRRSSTTWASKPPKRPASICLSEKTKPATSKSGTSSSCSSIGRRSELRAT